MLAGERRSINRLKTDLETERRRRIALEQPRRDWSKLATLVTAATAVGALIFNGISLQQSRAQINAVQTQNLISEQGQITDRMTAALENVGSTALDVRIGGIYELGRIANDSPRDQPAVVQILSAFVRDHSPLASHPFYDPGKGKALIGSDIQAALSVLGSRNPAYDDNVTIDFYDVDLRGADFAGGNFAGAYLALADLTQADVSHADFSRADLAEAGLSEADATGTNFSDAILVDADLTEASIDNATNFSKANLNSTDFLATDRCQGSNEQNAAKPYVCNDYIGPAGSYYPNPTASPAPGG